MEYPVQKIQSFTDLTTWKEGHRLVILVYQITKSFPREETYSLTDQMRRCVASITSNIAEGFSRRGDKEKVQFYYLAKGSLTELQNQLLIARDVAYLSSQEFLMLSELSISVHKLLNALIKSTQSRSLSKL